tara:strand:- start:769 stop:1095 length:327 start_codon:yes stop_codon:yes gene_type:complete
MGWFSAIVKGVKGILPAVIKGVKGASKAVKKGVKSAVNKIKNVFKKKPQATKKAWKEGDVPRGFVDTAQGKVAYKGGKPVKSVVKKKVKGEDPFDYIKNLTDPESIGL